MPMYKDENGATYTYPTELSKEAVANGNLAVMTEKEIAEMTKADDDLMKAGVDEHGFVNLHTDDKENGKGDGK